MSAIAMGDGSMAFLARPVLITAMLACLSGTSIADDRSVCGSDKGRPDQIVAACRRALAANPADLTVIWRLGNVLRVVRQYADCIDVYSKGIDILANPDPSMWPVFYFRGICYERNNQWEKAETDLRRALALKPDEPHVLNLLGYSLLDRGGRAKDVLRMLRRAVEQLPDDGDVADSLGWAYFRSGNYDEALKQLERAVRLKADEAQLHDHLGDVYAKLGRQGQARSEWVRARDLNPEPADLRKIEAKIASVPVSDNAKTGSAATNIDGCKPGMVEFSLAVLRQRLNLSQQGLNELFTTGQYSQQRFSELYNAGDLTGALEVAQNREAAARAMLGTKDSGYGSALLDLGRVCEELYAADQAEALYKSTLAIFEAAPS